MMLQIHGGSMNAGRAVADGSALAKRANAVIVSIQYRLGPLGFWAANASTPQNFGLDDLLFALRWARDNAGAFGGDPTRVMVFGVSAGGAAVGPISSTFPGVLADDGSIDRAALSKAVVAAGREQSLKALEWDLWRTFW